MHQTLYNKPDVENIGMTVKYRDEPAALSDVCLFSSFSFCGVVEEYVYYYLQELKKAGLAIVFISTSPLKDTCINRLSEYSFLVIERENKCPDFGSWKAGLSLLDWGRNLNSVLLANDSVFGPLFNIGDIISSMKDKYDLWGMTDSNEVDYHIQSYFLRFNKAAASSGIFSNFWKQVDLSASKAEVIHKYEIGLSSLFRNNNFNLGAYASIDGLTQNMYPGQRGTNPTLVFWKLLIQQYRFPFLKRELLIKMNISKTYWMLNLYIHVSGWKKTIEHASDYPVNYIDKFINNYHEKFKSQDDNNIILQKRKILFLANNAEAGERQQLLINFLQWLKKETDIKAEIIICNKGNNDLESEFSSLGVVTNFYDLSNAGRKNLKDRLIDEAALIFSNTIENIAVQKILSFLYIPQVVCVYEKASILKSYLFADNIKWLKKNVCHFITDTDASREIITNELGIGQENVELVARFVNFYTPEKSQNNQKEIRADGEIPENAFIIGMHGDLTDKKQAALLPVIAAELCRNYSDIHIIWIGNNTPGAMPGQVYSDLIKARLTDRIHLWKKRKNNRPYYNVFDVFVTIGGEYSFPLVILDVGLAGKPVISFEDPEEDRAYANFGLVHSVPYLNVHALSEKVFEYYNNRSQLAIEKEKMPQIVKQHFTTEVQAPCILKLIRQYYDEQELMLKEDPPLTFLTHIYYENTWEEIRNKLKNFDNGKNHFLFSISEACLVKDNIIADIRQSFKNAYFLVTSNIGKDIGGKMALIDIYLLLNISSAYIVFLHDKQSPHSIIGESWKKGLFKIIDPNYQSVIINLFRDPSVGIVGDKDNIVNEYDYTTGKFRNNSQLSKKLLLQFDMSIENYDFLGGSMYWIRSSVIKKFFSKNSPILMRENLEAGNVLDLHEERLAHTWERMFSWIATNDGLTIKGI